MMTDTTQNANASIVANELTENSKYAGKCTEHRKI